FVSSRRRHTRSKRDWSSDVCSSDLLQEIRGFCSDRGIPYKIMARYPNGKLKITKDTDRKPIVLARVRHYLATGDVGHPTCIPAEIVREDNPPEKPSMLERLYHRWYSKE